MSTLLGTLEVLKFQVSFLPSNFLSACVSKLPHSGRSRPGNLSRAPVPTAEAEACWNALGQPQPTHPVTVGSFLFLGKSNIPWEEEKRTLRNAGTAVGFSTQETTAKCCPQWPLTRFLLSRGRCATGCAQAGPAGGSSARWETGLTLSCRKSDTRRLLSYSGLLIQWS